MDTSRRFNFLKGKITVPDDFDTFMQDEIVAIAYEGSTFKSEHFFPAYPPLNPNAIF